MGFSSHDLRAFKVDHEEFIGKTVQELFKLHPTGPILRVVRDGKVVWIAIIGTTAALLPPFIAFVIGFKVFKLNSVIAAGAASGGRNNTPSMNAICAQSQSAIPAVPYSLNYSVVTVLALIGGYIAMILS